MNNASKAAAVAVMGMIGATAAAAPAEAVELQRWQIPQTGSIYLCPKLTAILIRDSNGLHAQGVWGGTSNLDLCQAGVTVTARISGPGGTQYASAPKTTTDIATRKPDVSTPSVLDYNGQYLVTAQASGPLSTDSAGNYYTNTTGVNPPPPVCVGCSC